MALARLLLAACLLASSALAQPATLQLQVDGTEGGTAAPVPFQGWFHGFALMKALTINSAVYTNLISNLQAYDTGPFLFRVKQNNDATDPGPNDNSLAGVARLNSVPGGARYLIGLNLFVSGGQGWRGGGQERHAALWVHAGRAPRNRAGWLFRLRRQDGRAVACRDTTTGSVQAVTAEHIYGVPHSDMYCPLAYY